MYLMMLLLSRDLVHGAMHGKNIKLIVTDKGAGVKHD
ncbi:hypothetical protein GEW_00430, partial [Pasteurella multocida subsp. gallicida str. Anand1_poultry]